MRIPFPGTYGHIDMLRRLSKRPRNECYMALIKHDWVISRVLAAWSIDIAATKK